MSDFWTRPQRVTAIRWTPDQGVLPASSGVGCAVCGSGYAQPGFLSSCLSPAQHDPWRHPHHLRVGTVEGERALFAGWWFVRFPDQTVRVYAPEEFAAQFTALPLLDVLRHFRDSLLQIADPRGLTERRYGGNYAARTLAHTTLEQWKGKGAV